MTDVIAKDKTKTLMVHIIDMILKANGCRIKGRAMKIHEGARREK